MKILDKADIVVKLKERIGKLRKSENIKERDALLRLLNDVIESGKDKYV